MAQVTGKEVTESLAAVVGEFVANVDLASAVARKWKCRAQVLDGAVFALYGDSVVVKTILVVSHNDTLLVPAKHVASAINWALWCKVPLVFAGPGKRTTFDSNCVDEIKNHTMPFISDAGVVVDLEVADKAINKKKHDANRQ